MKLPPERRALHIIALIKLAKGAVLLFIGFSLLFLDWREEILNKIILWADDELMLVHGKIVLWLLAKLEIWLHEANFKLTGYAALCYAALLVTEGVGVWKQQRWAEWLMILGTSSLIPFELYHLYSRPSLFKLGVVIINTLIAIYLGFTLARQRRETPGKS